MENKISTLNKISNVILISLTFLLPIFFLPTTGEFFEFNKQTLLFGLVGILLIVWSLNVLAKQKFTITKSIIDLPLLTFLFVVILSTIFAKDKVLSIYGSPGRWFPSLFGYLILVIFYYLTTATIKGLNIIEKVIYTLVASATISSIVAILSYYNIFLGNTDYFRISNFTLTGSVTSSVILAAIAIVVSLATLAYEESKIAKLLLSIAAIVNFGLVCITGVTAGWIVLGVGILATFIVIKPNNIFKDKPTILAITGALVVTLLATNLLTTKSFLLNSNYPKEINLSMKESWIVTSSIIRDYPLLATGPSTFYINYSRYKSLESNQTDTWNIKFDKTYNELFNIVANLGILGLLAVVYLGIRITKLIKAGYEADDEESLVKIITVALITTVAVFFVTYANILNSFLVFMFMALMVVIQAETGITKSAQTIMVELTQGKLGSKFSYLRFIIGIPAIALSIYGGYLMTRTYAAEVYTRMAIVAAQQNMWSKVYDYQTNAIKMNPQRDTYYTRYAQTTISLATMLSNKTDLTDNDKQTIQTLIAKAIKSAKIATETASPLNSRNWETRASIYRAITKATENASEWAVASYNIAVQLDPTNPKLRVDLGGVFFAKGDYSSAANQFRQAVALKPNYANAYYNLAQTFVKLGDMQNAKLALEKTKSLLPQESEDVKKVDEDIASLATMPTVAGDSTAKPSVETIEEKAPAKESTPTTKSQEPLSKVGQEEKVVGEGALINDKTKESTPTTK